MFDLNDFIFFQSNKTEIGIDFVESERIHSSIKNQKIKWEYIQASTPRHLINYNQFMIKKKLITVKDFRMFINHSSYITESEKEGWGWGWDRKWVKKKGVTWKTPFCNISDQYYNDNAEIIPVMQVSWNDAEAYTNWFSAFTGKIYRLPFEYEWEILAQHAGYASISNIYGSGNSSIYDDCIFILEIKDKLVKSEFQLGLVWEWMKDWYSGYDESVENKDFGTVYKTLRGGSLLSENYQRTKEFRFRRCPTARSPYYGFRIVLVPAGLEKSISS